MDSQWDVHFLLCHKLLLYFSTLVYQYGITCYVQYMCRRPITNLANSHDQVQPVGPTCYVKYMCHRPFPTLAMTKDYQLIPLLISGPPVPVLLSIMPITPAS